MEYLASALTVKFDKDLAKKRIGVVTISVIEITLETGCSYLLFYQNKNFVSFHLVTIW